MKLNLTQDVHVHINRQSRLITKAPIPVSELYTWVFK